MPPYRSGCAPVKVRQPKRLSNKRLKLTGGERLQGSGVLCAGAHQLTLNHRCAAARVARSLSAIRWAANSKLYSDALVRRDNVTDSA